MGDGTVGPDNLRPGVVANPAGDGPLTGVVQVDLAGSSACARVTGRQLRCWGGGTSGELGTGDPATDPLPVTTRNVADTGPLVTVATIGSGLNHRCVVLTNGQARCFGSNAAGQLGNGVTGGSSALPVVVGVP
jgi:alpha-tubulin suppressor-like RCC1 family protein